MISLEEAIKSYQRALIGQGRAPRSKRAFGYLLAMWGRWLDDHNTHWVAVTERQIIDYLEEYAERHSTSSTALMLTCLRSFYKWARRRGHVATSPAGDIDPVKRQRPLPRALLNSQVGILLRKMDNPPPPEALTRYQRAEWARNRMIVLTFLYTGLRLSEVADLRIERLDLEEGKMLVMGKGGKERMIPMHPELLQELRCWVGDRASGPLFISRKGTGLADEGISEMFRRWVVGFLGVSATAHQLRHTFATQLRRKHADLREIQELLGHAKLDTTRVYTAVYDDDLRHAVGRLDWKQKSNS